MENHCVHISTQARRNVSDHREMKLRIATQSAGFATIGSETKGL
ncbi:hypothetical protein [Dysgonomonas sp. 25]|nr:hypothetical protein [Dysgonomonas sp. 25]